MLNEEQIAAVEHKGGPLLIVAGAGTGKTTVITERIKWLISQKLAMPEEILALTFTEKAAKEMEERVDVALPYGTFGLWISTFHSFCDRILRSDSLHIGLNPGYNLMTETESFLFIKKNFWKFEIKYFRPHGNPYKFIGGMLQHFSRLKDEDIRVEEFAKWARENREKTKDNRQEDGKGEIEEADKYLELARTYEIYEKLKKDEGVMDFSDLISSTLRLFRERKSILTKYQNKFKYILVDEFQDTNYAQNEMLKLLAGEKANLTVVADDDQCLPPNTLISTINGDIPVKHIKVGDMVISAVGKGYLSKSKVLKVMKNKKKTRFLTFITTSGNKLEVTDNHKLFNMIPGKKFGTNNPYYVYGMYREDLGWRLGITDDLAQRLKLERSADKIIAIKSCASLEEAKFSEVTLSMKYQIPTYPFKPRKKMLLKEEWLEKLFNEFPTQRNIGNLASDYGIDINCHHYCLSAVTRGSKERIKVSLNMCVRKNRTKWAKERILLSPKVLHEVVMESSSTKIHAIVLAAGFKTLSTKKGWRIKQLFSNLEQAGKLAENLVKVTNGFLEVKFNVGKRNGHSRFALVMPAGNVLSGMWIPIVKNNNVIYEQVVSRQEVVRTETVYDLDVENTHNFVANGIVVHNSIYRFRGAAVSNVIQFRKTYPTPKVITLVKNYRSSQEILDRSYDMVTHNNPDRLEVTENIDKKLVAFGDNKKYEQEKIQTVFVDRVENEAEQVVKVIKEVKAVKANKYDWKDFAILVRANNHAEPFVKALERAKIPFQFLGPGMLFKQSEVKDLIAYLKVLDDFSDSVSMYRVLSMDIWGIPQRDIIAMLGYCRKLNISLFESLEELVVYSDRENPMKVSPLKVKPLVEIIHRHQEFVSKETAGQILFYFLSDSGLLKKIVEYKTADEERQAQNIMKFFDKLKSFEATHEDCGVFATVDYLDLAMEMGESPMASESDWSTNDAVNILTVHSAKGLEFPVVFLTNLVEGRFPSRERKEQIPIPEEMIKEVLPTGDFHIEEERRLFYVAMTRAKEKLYFTAANFYGEGKRERKICPFVWEALGEKVSRLSGQQVRDKEKQLPLFEWVKPTAIGYETMKQCDHIIIDYLSYSAIESFKVCPMHYKLRHILKVPTPTTASLSIGNSVHLALRDFYRQTNNRMEESNERLKGEVKDILMDLLNKNWEHKGYQSKKHEQDSLLRTQNFLEQYLETELHKTSRPIMLEQPFTFRLDPTLKIGGKIDRVDDLGNGMIEIVDYKTGGNIPTQKEVDANLQMTLYAMAAVDPGVFNKTIDQIKLSFYFFDQGTKISTIRTAEQLETAKKEVLTVREEIQNSDFQCLRGIFCQNCEYKMLCND